MIAASRATLAAMAFAGLRRTGMVVDLFAGGGGASLGLEWAGYPVDLAINHDAEALAMHMANHPYATHLCCDIREVCPRIATSGREVDVLWASPDCKHHSRAKGGKPLERAIRALAWVVVRWVEETLPKLVCVENVCEFQEWGPLGPDDRPIKEHKGDYFRAWVRRLRRLGYRVEWRELVAADYGAPTSRRRLFVVARRDGLAVTWPEPTHGPSRTQPWHTAAECINWDDPAPSIFDRKKPLAPKTQARIAKGIKRYVLQTAKPFVVGIDQSGARSATWSADAPLSTIVAKGKHALVGPTLVQTGYGERKGQEPRVPGLEKPLGTIVAKGKHALVTPVLERDEVDAVWLAKHYGGVVGQPADKPLGTVTAVDHHGFVSASMLKLRGTNVGSEAQEPLHTISAQGQHHGLLCAHVQRYYSLGGQLSAADAPLPTATAKARFALSAAVLDQYNSHSEPQPMDEPVPSVVSRDRFALVDMPVRDLDFEMQRDAQGRYVQVRAFLRRHGIIGPEDEAEVVIAGVRYRIVDIGMRMLRPRELYRAQGFPDTYQIAPRHRGKHLSATSQVRMCGNSVPPHFSCSLVTANLPALLAGREVAEAV